LIVHDDREHVPFSDALGYGVSTLLHWIFYILTICIFDAIMIGIVIIMAGVSVKIGSGVAMVFSLLLAFVAGFIMVVLSASLLLAMVYKALSDIGMKAASNITVERSAFPSLDNTPDLIFSQETEMVEIQETEMVEIQCPSCEKKFSVKKLGQLQDVKCTFCGQEGSLEI
jgi:ABC-type transport system involved in multi-copper enzyme maturation permease subunit